jgi:GcrA cell cycle regulator
MPGESWTAERIDLLRKLWAQGETAVVIAARLGGMSRSAVMGKVFRLRLHTDKASDNASSKENVRDHGVVTSPARRRRRTKYKQRSQPAPTTERQHKTLFELTNKTCRWPHGSPRIGRFFFCGAPEADLERGIPYCPAHMRRAYPTCVAGEAPTRAASRLLHHWR